MTLNKLSILLTLVILCTLTTPAATQEEGPLVTVTQVWQGYSRVPGWIEVEYILNQESDSWEGSLIIYDAANTITYRTPVFLPQLSQKYYRVPLLSTDGFDLTFSLNTADNQGHPIKLPVIPLSDDRVCAYIGTSTSAQQTAYTNCGTFLHLQSLAELPETPMVWDNVDVLIINGISTKALSDKQAEAMVAWVASGGHLVLSGGIALNLTLMPLPGTLQIVEPGPIDIISTIPKVISDVDIASAQLHLPPDSLPLIEAGDTTLAARKFIGKGMVDVLGWDVTQVDDTTWLQALWADDPVPATAIRIFGQRATSTKIGPSVYELQEIPSNPMPKMWVWLIIFILYVILIGPVTMLVIRRIKKPIYAWVMIPGWIVIALIMMSVIFSSTYGKTFPLIHDIAFISVNGGDLPARVVQGTAMTAPQSRDIIWSTSGYFRPLWGQHAVDTWNFSGKPYPLIVSYQPTISQIATVKPNGMITWGVEGTIDGIDLNASLSLSLNEKSPIITGSLYSEVDLTTINLVWVGSSSKTVQLAKSISAFETVVISTTMPVSPAYAEHTYSVCGMSDSQFREPMVKPIQPSASVQTSESICYITAKSSEVPFPTSDIAGAYTGESCIIQEVSCPEQASGVLTTHLLGYASGNDGGWIDTEMDIVSPYPPASTFTYHLPDYISVKQVSTISISIKPLDESQSQPYLDNKTITFFLLDWMKDDWVEQPLHRTTNTGEYTLLIQGENAQRFYDQKTQTIQVQLSVPENAYPQFKLPISIEGIW